MQVQVAGVVQQGQRGETFAECVPESVGAAFDEPGARAISILVTSINDTFDKLEQCFSTEEGTAPTSARVALATQLAGTAVGVVAALRVAEPELYQEFVATWRERP